MNRKFLPLLFNVIVLHILLIIIITLFPLKMRAVISIATILLYGMSISEIIFIIMDDRNGTGRVIEDILYDVRVPRANILGILLCFIAYFVLTHEFANEALIRLITFGLADVILVVSCSVDAKKFFLLIYLYVTSKYNR